VNKVRFEFDVPEKSQYHGRSYEVDIAIPESYPSEPLECYIK
jgi:ubiquitin-protein ligase